MSSAAGNKNNTAPRLTAQVRRTISGEDALADPVGRQYVPDEREDTVLPHEDADPIGDDAHSPVKGVVHRYPDRVLLKITDTCAVYCRFCFRKEMVGKGDGILKRNTLEQAYAYIESRPQIREVILTGGDPLTLSNRRLKEVLDRLSSIPHLDIVRFHTRAPLVDPGRVDEELCALLADMAKAVYVVLHVNHAQEIDERVRAAFRRLNGSGAVLLSQSVLLKGVNDDPAILEDLFRTLLKNRVKPYYLHHPDLAPGTSHFRLSIARGQEIVSALRGRVTGLAWPTYVLDIPGGHGKMPLMPSYIRETTTGCYLVEDYQGTKHKYEDDLKQGTE